VFPLVERLVNQRLGDLEADRLHVDRSLPEIVGGVVGGTSRWRRGQVAWQ
jgi:hypothetical protein